MSEHKTEVVVNAKAKGFQQVQQQAGKLMDAATKAATTQAKGYTKLEGNTKAYRAEIKKLEASLRGLEKQQLSTLKALGQTDKTTKAYKALHEQFRNLNAEAQRLAQAKGLVQKLYGPKGPGGQPLTGADMARGGFTQGFMQSMGIPLQRGPGMWRQGAGMATGTMLKGFAGSPFGGVSGVAQGLAGIPVVGGFAAGQFQNAMQFGEGALGVQKSRLGMAPFLGASESGGNIAEARRRARAGVQASQFAGPGGRFPTKEEIADKGERAAAAVVLDALKPKSAKGFAEFMGRGAERLGKIAGASGVGGLVGGTLAGPGGLTLGSSLAARWATRKTKEGATLAGRSEAARAEAIATGEAPERAYTTARDAAGEAAARRERAEPFKEIRAAGLKYGGLSEADALQAAQGVLQAGGGGMRGLRQSGMLETSFAAQSKYGIGADVSGAYLGAGRVGRGGLVGANETNQAEAMTSAIQDGLMMGLEGSELQDYMAQMAQGINAWKTTGIPINQGSIGRLGQAITDQTTLGGLRGSTIGRGLATAAQGVSETGVQDAIDLQMLQTMGGFKGGSLEDYEKAQVQLEEMGGPEGWGPEQMKEMVTKLTGAGGGGASGRQVLRKAFARKGIKMSQAETMALEKGVMEGPEKLEGEDAARYAKIQDEIRMGSVEGMPTDAGDLQAQAQEIMKGYGAAVQRAAAIQNKQNGVGEQMMTTLQNLQSAQASITTAFTKLTSGGLEKISGYVNDFAKSLETLSSSSDKAAAALEFITNVAKQL